MPNPNTSTTRVRKSGNSASVTLPKNVLEQAGIQLGDSVTIVAEAGRLIIEPIDPVFAEAMQLYREFSSTHRNVMRELAK
ncbi:AbrB/MazE/SpoVT family DNA-binding domain-containing protein [Synechococcus sp. PCC 7336]|uniref:AbrB/MazE/SpoVT family DNA-binding domain-containing protein n=1 Tax=Synechococcus sp. PCC 7336 TaxID=195250 RepID=UPI00037CC48A|nr:AbrB/MazE/SpoVT family DNA-binding domain-containing protein [Synechococcus sp. PCC 7336]